MIAIASVAHRCSARTATVTALTRVGGRLGYQAGLAALRAKISSLGVTPFVLSTFERELNREGLSLGPLAVPPPMPGTLAAMTPTAIAGNVLARKLRLP